VTFTFGGMLWGVVPIVAGVNVSWQSHLFGFIGGVLVSKVLGDALRRRRR
jgi:membrane associated rhomboid family serine protease